MTTEIHQILNSVAIIVTLLGVIWLAAVKITRLEVKVDTMWAMLLKRAVVEGVHKGLMEVHSPIRLINDSGKMLESMAGELQEFYKTECQGISESKAALVLERRFGTRLATEICIPNNISFGICIILALSVAKGNETLTEILDNVLPLNQESPVIRHGS